MDFKEKLYNKASDIGITLDDIQLYQYEKYYHMLIEKNKVMNLTSITEEDEVIDKHFIDSLTCSRVIDFSNTSQVADIGTGAGFPGIPLKIAFPDMKITLIDSLNKRIRFLEEVSEELKLENVFAIHGRAEDLARKKDFRECFDLCVSRAVANLSTLSEYCLPFVKIHGYFVSYKSKKGLEEIKNSELCMKELGSRIVQVDEFCLTDQDSERLLIKIEKMKATSKKYPRKAGIPSRNPL